MKTNRIFALLLAAVMLLSIFTGCNTATPDGTDPSGSVGTGEHVGSDETGTTNGTTDTTTGTEGTTEEEDPAGNETISGTETTEPSNNPTTNPSTQPSGCSHNWSDWTTKKTATCTADGSEERSCSKCGEKEQRAAAATGHNWDSGKESGSNITYTCTVCGKTKTEQITGNHTFGSWSYEEYTYKQQGIYPDIQWYDRVSHRKYRTCTKCGYKETDGTPDHPCQRGSDNHVVTTVKAGTCTTKATMRSTCKVCGWYVEYEGKKSSHTIKTETRHLTDYGTYTNELDAIISECTSCGAKAVNYQQGEGWSDYNRYRMKWSANPGAAYAGQPITDNFAHIDHPEWQMVFRNFKYDSEGYVKEFTIYWWYNGSRYSQVIDCGEGVWESWFAEYNMADDGAYNYTYQIRCFGTYWEPWKRTWTSQSG